MSIMVNVLLSALLLAPTIQHKISPTHAKLVSAEAFTFVPNSFHIGQKSPEPLPAPVRLIIPKIRVNAAVEQVGLTPAGAMGAPKERSNVAWFNLGTRPGESGSAVIAGHYGWKDAKGSAFDGLYKLRHGDTISVEDSTGTRVSFVVREIRRYADTDSAPDVFGSSDGKAHLNLVTCEGTWNPLTKSYSRRLVVFADKEESVQ